MEELVSAIHGVEFALWFIWLLLFLILIKELISVLMKK